MPVVDRQESKAETQAVKTKAEAVDEPIDLQLPFHIQCAYLFQLNQVNPMLFNPQYQEHSPLQIQFMFPVIYPKGDR